MRNLHWRAFSVCIGAVTLAGIAGCSSSPKAASPPSPSPTTSASSPTPTPTASVPPSSPSSVTPTVTPTTPPAPTEAANLCRLSELAVTIGGSQGAAGTVYTHLLFRNIGARTCQLHGYPGVALLDAAGRQAAQAVRGPGEPPGPYTVTLSPQQIASAVFRTGDMPIGNATSCPQYNALLVTPPDETHSVTLRVTALPDCGIAYISPVVLGTGM